MTTRARSGALPEDPHTLGGRLSGRIVGRLSPAEQFVLWALRRRLADGGVASPTLVHGFRLAFGLAAMEAALAAFEGLFRALAGHARREICLCPVRCACVSTDEERILRLVTAAQTGCGPTLEALASELVAPPARAELRRDAAAFAFALRRATLDLPAQAEGARRSVTLLH